MRRAFITILFAMLILGSQETNSLGIADRNYNRKEAEALLAHAQRISDIRAEGSSPFLLRARVQLLDLPKSPVDGVYLLLWVSLNQWREEFIFPGYSLLRGVNEEGYWEKRPAGHVPYRIYNLRFLTDLSATLSLHPDEQLRKVRQQKRGGVKVRCIETGTKKFKAREVCLDLATETLTVARTFFGFETTYQYSSYRNLNNHLFPWKISVWRKKKALVEILVEEWNQNPEIPPTSFSAPAGSIQKPRCASPRTISFTLKKISDVPPRYPKSARLARRQGTVQIFTLIDGNGHPTNLEIIQSAGSDIDRAALDAVQQWRWSSPPTCEGSPMEVSTIVTVVFRLR